MKKNLVKPEKIFKRVYVVQNFGTFRGLFYYLKEAKQFVKEQGTYDNEEIYQIYICDVLLSKIIQK